eukprot:364091-Chlamydomonas_euryale.AAC.3
MDGWMQQHGQQPHMRALPRTPRLPASQPPLHREMHEAGFIVVVRVRVRGRGPTNSMPVLIAARQRGSNDQVS